MPKGLYAHKRRSIEERFWGKVDKKGPVPNHCPELGQCWIWKGARFGHGYGHINSSKGVLAAHVVAWELAHSPVPKGANVCHKCDNPSCVRIEHLFLGTWQENMIDMVVKRRNPHGEGHHWAKLSANQVLEIRSRYERGNDTLLTIAADYGVSFTTIHAVVSRRSWPDI